MRWLSRFFAKAPAPQPLTADLLQRIRRSFEEAAADEEHFPSTIDPRIYHVRLVLEYLSEASPRRVLDAGCGKGRFARLFKDAHREAVVVALDLAESMLRVVTPETPPVCASLTRMPFPDGAFDALYATESLEHAVDIPGAVAELCRVVRPGGRIVIIDKNAEQWGKLDTPDWERWFHPRELESLLQRHCRQVWSKPISYWQDVPPDGLFHAWMAEK